MDYFGILPQVNLFHMVKKNKKEIKIAYFSMEIAIKNHIKSYSGGLGVLAGDTLKAAADLNTPMLGVTLLNDRGYFKQVINEKGEQKEEPDEYDYSKFKEMVGESFINIKEDKVKVHAWEYKVEGSSGHSIPIYFLDTDVEGNKEKYRKLTGKLYGGNEEYRLMQEIVLGRGGAKLLPILGHDNIEKYHLNEGHAALVGVELFLKYKRESSAEEDKGKLISKVRDKCVFTTHTPIKAGHDVFRMDTVKRLQPDFPSEFLEIITENRLNMSRLALYSSSYVNGVALSHQKISTEMFPGREVSSITNGVHSRTWISPEFKKLFDEDIPNWRHCSMSLRNALNISPDKIWRAHQKAKEKLINHVEEEKSLKLSKDIFTIGFARRFTGYKRSTLLLHDMGKLLEIHDKVGKIQIIYAGKAHPSDWGGKEMIKKINETARKYEDKIKIVFLEDYDMELAKLLIPGVDIWLNTPLPPNEASGTSGMKAAHNGVPHFSTLDGWWLEGCVEGKTGWAIGEKHNATDPEELIEKDAADLYDKLENKILPCYYQKPEIWRQIMRQTIAINASFFNSERMLREYTQEAYL